MGVIWEKPKLRTYTGFTWTHELSVGDGGPGPVPKHWGLPWHKTVSGVVINVKSLNRYIIFNFRRDNGF